MIIKKILCTVISIVMSISTITSITVEGNASTDGRLSKWSATGKYPVTPESPEWSSMSYIQQLEVCDMPEEILSDCTSEVLAQYVLEYPFLVDILAFDTAGQGINHLCDTSNICREFFSREDSVEILLKEYDSLKVDYYELTNDDSDNPMTDSGYTKELFLQAFFAYSLNKLDKYETDMLLKILSDKLEAKSSICDDFSTGMLFYDLLQNDLGYIPAYMVTENITEQIEPIEASALYSVGFTPTSATTTFSGVEYTVGSYSKYGCSVVCYKYLLGDYCDSELIARDKAMANTHPGWGRIDSATKKYNCHSYAWISTLPNNEYWLPNPDRYASSSYFNCLGTNCSANIGDIIIIRDSLTTSQGVSGTTNAVHSLIVTSSGAGVTSIGTKSKLGSLGVYSAQLADMMAFYKGYKYNVYRKN